MLEKAIATDYDDEGSVRGTRLVDLEDLEALHFVDDHGDRRVTAITWWHPDGSFTEFTLPPASVRLDGIRRLNDWGLPS